MKLDFEQRQEAERLLAAVSADEDALRGAIYELVAMRDLGKRVVDWLAKEDIEGDPDDLYSGREHRVKAINEIISAPTD